MLGENSVHRDLQFFPAFSPAPKWFALDERELHRLQFGGKYMNVRAQEELQKIKR